MRWKWRSAHRTENTVAGTRTEQERRPIMNDSRRNRGELAEASVHQRHFADKAARTISHRASPDCMATTASSEARYSDCEAR